jgi:hypothetical protein
MYTGAGPIASRLPPGLLAPGGETIATTRERRAIRELDIAARDPGPIEGLSAQDLMERRRLAWTDPT